MFRQIEDQIVMKIEDLDLSQLTYKNSELQKSKPNSAKKTNKSKNRSAKKSVIDFEENTVDVSQELKTTFLMPKDR